MSAFPDHPSAFDAAWLAGKLGAPADALAGFTFAPIGTGQVADSFRLTLDWRRAAGPASIVAKCSSRDDVSRATATAMGLYAREAEFYRALAPRCAIRAPRCHAVDIDESGGSYVLLLEDCAPARQGDQLAGAGRAQIEAVIDEAARLHAPFLNDPSLKAHDWLTHGQRGRESTKAYFRGCWPEFKARYAARFDAAIFAMGDELAARFDAYLDAEPPCFSVVHGDLRIDNVLFGGAEGRAVILDWQTIGLGHPVADISYLIGASFADADARRAAEPDLLARYGAAMAAAGAPIAADEIRRAYAFYAAGGFVMAVISSMIVKRTERGDEMFAVMAERPALQMRDRGTLELI